jgi:Protein of unknown function (DUF2442)
MAIKRGKSSKKAAPKKAAKKKAVKKAAKKAAPKRAAPKKAAVKKAAKRAAPRKKLARRAYLKQRRAGEKISNFGSPNKGAVNMNALIKDADFVHDYVLMLTFTDGHTTEVDFSEFLNSPSTPEYLKAYKIPSKFRRFRLVSGNVVWGRNWDLIFPLSQLYRGEIELTPA